jgi:2-C-methyl-D-erythritol 4-phosphate cytidylyltransferase
MTTQPRYYALIPAAGVGARMAGATPKQYLNLAGKPMLRHALDAFLGSALIAHTFVVVSPGDDQIDALLPLAGVTVLRCGGASRMASVFNGLVAMQAQVADHDWILVHDAARPGLNPALIAKLIAGVANDPVGGLLALPVVDTVKRASSDACAGASLGASAAPTALATVARDGLWLAQTPQMFRYQLLHRALDCAPDAGAITDDASAVEALDIGIAEMYLAHHRRNQDPQPAQEQPA